MKDQTDAEAVVSQDAEAVVSQFVERLSFALLKISQLSSGLESRSTALWRLRGTDDRRIRSGKLDSLGTFKLHGAGCRLQFSTGEVVDFDWNDRGQEIFDSWRLHAFAKSTGQATVTRDQLEAAAVRSRALASDDSGWFRLR